MKTTYCIIRLFRKFDFYFLYVDKNNLAKNN